MVREQPYVMAAASTGISTEHAAVPHPQRSKPSLKDWLILFAVSLSCRTVTHSEIGSGLIYQGGDASLRRKRDGLILNLQVTHETIVVD